MTLLPLEVTYNLDTLSLVGRICPYVLFQLFFFWNWYLFLFEFDLLQLKEERKRRSKFYVSALYSDKLWSSVGIKQKDNCGNSNDNKYFPKLNWISFKALKAIYLLPKTSKQARGDFALTLTGNRTRGAHLLFKGSPRSCWLAGRLSTRQRFLKLTRGGQPCSLFLLRLNPVSLQTQCRRPWTSLVLPRVPDVMH